MGWWCNECGMYHDTSGCPGNIVIKWQDTGPPLRKGTIDTTTVTKIEVLEAEIDRLKIELQNSLLEIDELKEQIRNYDNRLTQAVEIADKVFDEHVRFIAEAGALKGVVDYKDKEIARLKDLLQEAVDILDTIVPDTFAVGKMIHALSKWKQKAERSIGGE